MPLFRQGKHNPKNMTYARGFAAGRLSAGRQIADAEWAARQSVLRQRRHALLLQGRVRALESKVFVHGHDGTRPIDLYGFGNGQG